MSFETKVALIDLLNAFTYVLQGFFILALIFVAWLAWKRGKKMEHLDRKEILKTLFIGLITCVFFLLLVGVPWNSLWFWIIGGIGLPFGFFLTQVMKVERYSAGKLHIKNYRIYAIIWAITVFVGEVVITFLDPKGIGGASSFLFGAMVLLAVSLVNVYRYQQARALSK